MKTEVIVKRTRIPAPAAEVFQWHDRPDAFEQLTPPWERVRVVERTGGIADGRMVLEMRIGPIRRRWIAQHVDFQPGRQFRDVQIAGPFAHWKHAHGRAGWPVGVLFGRSHRIRASAGMAGQVGGGALRPKKAGSHFCVPAPRHR
jgi:hypothetical protein